MTTNELSDKIASGSAYSTLEVDHETFANVCQFYFTSKSNGQYPVQHIITISLGKNNGLMFKGVELILKKNLQLNLPT